MKEVNTTPGKTFSVHTMKGCTIIEPDGWQKSIEAPDGYFDAHFGSVVIEGDDEASIKQLFKLAPQQRLALLGVLGGNVPAWFAPLKAELTALLDGSKFELAWLASKKTLVVHTDRADDTQLEAVTALLERVLPQNVEAVHSNYMPMPYILNKITPILNAAVGGEANVVEFSYDYDTSNMRFRYTSANDIQASVNEIFRQEVPPHVDAFVLWEKYINCTNRNDMLAVNSDYINDYDHNDMVWKYDLPNLKNASGVFVNAKFKKLAENITLDKMTHAGSDYSNGMFYKSKIEALPERMTLENLVQGGGFVCDTNAQLPKSLNLINLINGLCMFNGTSGLTAFYSPLPKLENGLGMFKYDNKLAIFESTLPSLKIGTQMFFSCILDKESTLRVLNSIPAYTSGTHELGIGIHIDHQTDEEVLAAIANAEAKGWTLTVQWNGTPTAQAATTYGLRKPPIYARVEERELPDGTVERRLDWGHYVTDPTGYEEFRSVEAAREYFGLPDEPLTNN